MKLHPRVSLYGPIASQQIALGRRDDAEQTLRKWAEADSENSEPLRRLAGVQLDNGRAAAAANSAAAAVALAPKEGQPAESLQLLLGRAQLRAGMKERAEDTLKGLLSRTETPGIMNDAAYELANAGLDLPLAAEKSQLAVARMEEESQTWTLDEDEKILRGKTQLLQAAWDTVGWILFQNGKLDEAERYIRASWSGRQNGEVGMHLGDIAQKKGDKNEALRCYKLALATIPPMNISGVSGGSNPIAVELLTKVAELEKAGARLKSDDSAAALAKMRNLPAGQGSNGYGEYKLMIAPEGLVRAEPTTDKIVINADGIARRARFANFFPEGSRARLVFSVILNCHQGICELIQTP